MAMLSVGSTRFVSSRSCRTGIRPSCVRDAYGRVTKG